MHARIGFWIYCLVAILVAIVAMNTGVNLLFWIFGVMAAAILAGGIVSGQMMMVLDVRRLPTRRVVVGEPAVLRYVVRNRARLMPAFGLFFEEVGRVGTAAAIDGAPAWIMHVGPGETVHAESVLRPHRRGVARLPAIRMSSGFPFGILDKSITFERARSILVLPRTYELRPGMLRELQPRGAAGARLGRRPGSGDDFFGMRDYRPGDPLRSIAWKRTANRDELLVIERTQPTPPRLRVALDLTIPTNELGVTVDEPVDARELEERAISLAASIIAAADHAGFEIGLSILGLDHEPIPVRRSARHRDRILAELARIELDHPRTERMSLPPIERDGAGLAVVHPARVGADLAPGIAVHYSARQFENLVVPDGRDSEEDSSRETGAGGDSTSRSSRPRGRRSGRSQRTRSRPSLLAMLRRGTGGDS